MGRGVFFSRSPAARRTAPLTTEGLEQADRTMVAQLFLVLFLLFCLHVLLSSSLLLFFSP